MLFGYTIGIRYFYQKKARLLQIRKSKSKTMRNLRLILTATVLFLGTVAFAQKTAEERSTAITERMATELALTTEQKPKVQALNLAIAQKNDAIRNDTKLTKEQKVEAIKGNHNGRYAELKQILTPQQMTVYDNLVEKWKAERKAGTPNKANTRKYVRKSVTLEDL